VKEVIKMAFTMYSVCTISTLLAALTAGEKVTMNELIATQMMNDLNIHWVDDEISKQDFIRLRNILAEYTPSYRLLPPEEIIERQQ
jgi:hypothetical protein